jgi:hypothetical protein
MGIPLQDARKPYLHVPSDVPRRCSGIACCMSRRLQVRDSLFDKCRDPNMVPTPPHNRTDFLFHPTPPPPPSPRRNLSSGCTDIQF